MTLLAFSCAGLTPEPVAKLRGQLELSVDPNPIVATPLGNDLYELKFDIVMREAGGVGVRIEDFTVDAVAYGTVTVRSQTYPSSFITGRGYPSSIAAGKYLRFSFTKRWTLPTSLLLSGASARVTARTIDDNGVHAQSFVRVGVVVERLGTDAGTARWPAPTASGDVGEPSERREVPGVADVSPRSGAAHP